MTYLRVARTYVSLEALKYATSESTGATGVTKKQTGAKNVTRRRPISNKISNKKAKLY